MLIIPGNNIVQAGHNPKALTHIFLSIVTTSMLCIAAVQAVFLAIQEKALRKRQTGIMRLLPPLQTMEVFLFQTIALGFILLTTVIATSFIFFHHLFVPGFVDKAIFTSLSWLIFGLLLIGRYLAGWRGKIAIRGTLIGFLCLLLTYLGAEIFTVII
jgi:ABC-type uncharacterized transport system permease subunit